LSSVAAPLGAEVDTGIREGAQGISPALTKIAALDLQEFSTADRDMIMETITSHQKPEI